MTFYFVMVNAWSLLASILDGTFEEDYPVMNKKEIDEKTGLWKNPDPYPLPESSAAYFPSASQSANAYEEDGLEYENNLYENCSGDDYMSDIDDMYSHHLNKELGIEPMAPHFFKYHEEEILKDIEEYVSSTYQGHYTGSKHEFRKVQTIDLMAARDIASNFCQANILKYGSRYGSKDGKNQKDLMKVIHYAMLLLHFDGHYGEPSMPSGNFDQMP